MRWSVATVGVLVAVLAIGVIALARALYWRSAKGTGWLHNTEQERSHMNSKRAGEISARATRRESSSRDSSP